MRTVRFDHDTEFNELHYEPGDMTDVEDVDAFGLYQTGFVTYMDGPAPEEAPEAQGPDEPRRGRRG
jgi:hypothetical protein